jgi:serine protease AprX
LEISIYPNPSQDKIRLKMLKGQRYLGSEVTDVLGTLILKTSDEKFNVCSFKSRKYFVKVKTDKGELTEKFSKN